MSDQCKNCIVRGDYEKCIATECFKHESWIDMERIAMIENLQKLVTAVGCGDISGLFLNDIDGQNWFDFRDKLLAEDEECNHNWVSADNEVVTGGLMCTKCFMLNPQPPPGGKK